ncbi:hypothetical protein U0C82_03950 [Fulvimarina sp. 2208YS6-2-32]|uniref:Uncharacterized protein n=1 Tax=Fulvimarina uroteuthidis TaxID=3098149 RepID=A0ABU5HZZ0_9HYPH|nr:hypothetical protein [Fulvimarina sp. 2208YS6-2-32]MDY8108303.1 hypothetical protein [Fulvimarina sp. 2208YS6-2-32]
MPDSAELHNELARKFVMDVASQVKTEAEMMVVVESTLLAAMLVMTKGFNAKPGTSVGMIEAAVQRATERFTEKLAGADAGKDAGR